MNLRPEVAEQVMQFEADTPLGRMATVDELVGPAIFLLSDAASFCTGWTCLSTAASPVGDAEPAVAGEDRRLGTAGDVELGEDR